MKVLLFGPRGYLGQQFLTLLPDALTSDADIADAPAVGAALDALRPDVVINAAGKTGRPNIDWCEDHREETLRANVTGPLVLLEECGKRGVSWVHLSSGCIYDGDKGGEGWSEDDPPNFSGSFYSRTKAWADQILREFPACPERSRGVLILRLRMPFDDSTNPRSLLMKLTHYRKVLDVENSLTYLPDFLKAAQILIEGRKTGIYNVVNPGSISPYRLMELYSEIVDPDHRFERLTLSRLSSVVRAGRSNCILSTEKLEREGILLRPIEDAVRAALEAVRGRTPAGALA